MTHTNTRNVHPDDVKKIEKYLEEKGLFLTQISKSVNDFAIAHVSLIEEPEDIEEQRDFEVIINLRKNICYKFDFWGHRTDGLRIYNYPQNTKFKILNPTFHISFIETLLGKTASSYILITYTDFIDNHTYNDGNNNGKIYAKVINPESKFSLGRRFEFYDFLNCDNSVKVYEIDPEIFPCIFTYHLISKLKYDDEVYEEYGIWNGSIWGSNNRIIPVGESRDYTWCTYHISNTCGEDNIEDNIYKKAEELMTEIKEEQQEAAKYD